MGKHFYNPITEVDISQCHIFKTKICNQRESMNTKHMGAKRRRQFEVNKQ